MYDRLSNPDCFIEGNLCNDIMQLFKQLKQDNHMDILNDLANKACLEPNYSISQEVENYHKRQEQRIKQEIADKNGNVRVVCEFCKKERIFPSQTCN